METVFPTPPPRSIRPLKRAEYERLAAEGYFDSERVELVFGTVVTVSPADPIHSEAVRKLDELLRGLLGARARVSCQHPFAASDDSEPEPDLFVFPPGDYWSAHPDRAHLVVEVANTTLDYDRSTKAALYGASQVDEYWIVNLAESVVEVHRDRRNGRWRSLTTYGRDQSIVPLAFPDVVVPVAAFLPPTTATETPSAS